MMKKINLAVLFGGQSSEHEVSCMSAVNIIDQIDKERYEFCLLYTSVLPVPADACWQGSFCPSGESGGQLVQGS